MKILHVITLSELGGAQSVILNLAKSSVMDGHEVMVASSEGGDLWNELPDQVKKQTVPSLQRAINLSKDWQVIKELKAIYRNFKPDVVHLHSSKIGILGRLAFPKNRTIYTVHGFDSIRVAFRKFLYLEKLFQYRGKHIVAVSKYDNDNLIAEGINRNVSYIYNGISDFKEDVTQKNDDTQFLNLKKTLQESNKFNVLCIARLAPPKRFDLFCETAEQLKEHNINFYWVGNKQAETNTPANVHCLGELTNAHRLLPFSHVFMLASDYEGMPMSILEALCYGIPVVASNVGGIVEVLNTKNGYALQNEASLFAKQILDYKNTSILYEQAKIHARKSYLQDFTVKKMYQSYLSLYKSTLNKLS